MKTHCFSLFFASLSLSALTAAAEPAPGWSSHATDHHFVAPREPGVELTQNLEQTRLAWSHRIHTGFGKGGGGTAVAMLEDGFDPAYGETGSPILSDGVLFISWSQPTGEVTADLSTITDRYFDNEAENLLLQDNYYRIDADWHTIALDAATGDTLWTRVQPSASLNFLSTKRGHNGLSGAARDGLYVTQTLLGEVFAYEIASGDLRWSAIIEDWNTQAEGYKQMVLAERRMPTQDGGPFGTKRSGAIIVENTVVVPDLQNGLVGLSVADGSEIWRTADVLHAQATPTPWKHEGVTYLICNQASGTYDPMVHLLDPRDGQILWSFATGYNPGQLLVGEDHLLLNDVDDSNNDALLACYQIGIDGLEFKWRFSQYEEEVHVKKDFGAQRKGVIRDGVLYLLIGLGHSEKGFLASYDLATGIRIHAEMDPRLGENTGMPFIAEDKIYVQMNSAHAGSRAGPRVYQLGEGGMFTYLGDIVYEGFGVKLMTDYLHPLETPYAGGLLFLRGHRQIAAVDLSTPTKPMADLRFEDAWAGFARPVSGFLFSGADGLADRGRLESPPRKELGVVGTSAHRNDSWTQLILSGTPSVGSAFTVDAEFNFVNVSWPGTLAMNEAEGDQWTGTWSRYFPGWEEPLVLTGSLHESSEGGYDQRGWPTGWLPNQPVTFFEPLPEGQERVFLQLIDFLPRFDELKNLTLSLDHDGERVVSGVGGGFSFNQSYHEIDPSGLSVTENGITGTALLIINSDAWIPGDRENGGSLAGYVTLDIAFGEPDADGIYALSGDWSVEWGIELTRSGAVTGTLSNMTREWGGLKMVWDSPEEDFLLTFFAEAGTTYQLQSSTTLMPGSWVNSGAAMGGTGETMTIRRATSGSQTFYRLVDDAE
jgi:outer membrane protein assembly factor BamB